MLNSNSNITPQTKTISFQGWDASKPLKKIYFGLPTMDFDNFYPVMEELAKVEEKEGIRFFYIKENGIINNASKKIIQNSQKFFNQIKKLLKKEQHSIVFYTWLQDVFTQTPKGKILYQDFFNYKNFDDEDLNFLGQEIAKQTKHRIYNPNKIYNNNVNQLFVLNHYIAGGNIFQGIKKNKNPYTLLGSNCENALNRQQIFDIFNTNNIYYVPSADFHLDLFIRPLNNGKILVTDDNLTLEFLNNIEKELKQNPNMSKEQISKFKDFINTTKNSIQKNNRNKQYATTQEVSAFLKSKGFEVINIPGRFFNFEKLSSQEIKLTQNANFMNSFVQKRKNGTFGYITNHANPQYTGGIDINPYFEKYLKEICPEITDIYFISGKNNIADYLRNYEGGIHCRGAEFI